jgi:hypothetical protein
MKEIIQDNLIEYYDVDLFTSAKSVGGVFDGGVYNSKGTSIKELNLIRNNKYCTNLQVENKNELISFTNNILELAIFGGYLFHHFGHFLVETLNRYYGYKNIDLPIVFISPTAHSSKYQRKIFKLLGVEDKIYIVKDHLKVKKLIVNPVGYRIPDYFINENFLALGVYKKQSDIYIGKKIWISRSKLNKRYIVGENLLESKLNSEGWLIVHPEELEIENQLQIFSSAIQIAGFAGSAFHSVILCKDIKVRLDIFILGNKINNNFINIAKAKNINQFIHDIELRPKEESNYINCFWELSAVQIDKIIERIQ